MHSSNIVFSSLLLAIHAGVGHSTPVASGLQRRVDCDEVSKYTIDYFMENKIRDPEASTCLFYTEYLSGAAKRFAHSGGASMTTIWDMWSCDHYNGDKEDENNRLRCIFQEKSKMTEYFEHMSEAMAISCDNFATVMTDKEDPPQDGIWGRTEQPALQRTGNPGGQVDTIVSCDPSGGNVKIIWERPGTLSNATARAVALPSQNEKRQDEDPDRCYTPDQIDEWFGDAGW